MTVQFDDGSVVEVVSGVYVYLDSKSNNLYKDYEQLTKEQQLAYYEFVEDVKRAYRRLLST